MTFWDYTVGAIALGIADSFNPYMLSMVLCLLIFLTASGNTLQQIAHNGKFVVGSAFVLTFFLAWNENALWIENPLLVRSSYFLSLGVAVALLATGYLLLRQWWQAKKQSFAPPLPACLIEGSQTAGKSVGVTVFSVILGLAVVPLNALWPEGQANYIFHYFLFTSGDVLLATLFFTLYALALTCWLWAVWGMVFYIKRSIKLRTELGAAISWLKICFSAIFIAVGFGLIYLFLIT